jgi:spore coat protein A
LNLGPDEPYGGGIPGIDFDPSDPATTGNIMQFQVSLPLSGVPEAIVSTASVLNSIARFDPALADNAATPRQLVLFEGMDEFGRLQPMLGTMADGSKTWTEAITENPANRSTEVWEVYNATGDAHPIHLHLVAFQILNRESFVGDVTARPQIQHNSLPGVPPPISTPPTESEILALRAMNYGIGGVLNVSGLVGDVTGPADYERGWKDTFIVPPGQVGRLIARFDRPGRYVWHCHILSHEDHEMMRAFHVGPIPAPPPQNLKSAAADADQEQINGFRLYPNPASELITVDLMLEKGAEISISIYGLDGRIINSEELGYLNDGIQSIAVPVGHLDNGMYIVELKAGDKQFRQSIIISK